MLRHAADTCAKIEAQVANDLEEMPLHELGRAWDTRAVQVGGSRHELARPTDRLLASNLMRLS
jgi:hypothetical protein